MRVIGGPAALPYRVPSPLRSRSTRILRSSSLLLRLTRRRARCAGPFLYHVCLSSSLYFPPSDQDASQLHDRGPAASRAAAWASLDHLVGAQQERCRHINAKCLRSFEVDDKLKLGRLFNRHIGRLGALEDAGDVLTDLAVRPGNAGAITHQATSLGIFAPGVGRRHCIARREGNQLGAPAIEEWIGADEQRLSALPLVVAEECTPICVVVGHESVPSLLLSAV